MTALRNADDIFRLAIDIEEFGRDKVHRLVDEEMSHLILLYEKPHTAAPDGSLPD